jgi:hypothetical protein
MGVFARGGEEFIGVLCKTAGRYLGKARGTEFGKKMLFENTFVILLGASLLARTMRLFEFFVCVLKRYIEDLQRTKNDIRGRF